MRRMAPVRLTGSGLRRTRRGSSAASSVHSGSMSTRRDTDRIDHGCRPRPHPPTTACQPRLHCHTASHAGARTTVSPPGRRWSPDCRPSTRPRAEHRGCLPHCRLSPASNPGGLAALLAIRPVAAGDDSDTAEAVSDLRADRM